MAEFTPRLLQSFFSHAPLVFIFFELLECTLNLRATFVEVVAGLRQSLFHRKALIIKLGMPSLDLRQLFVELVPFVGQLALPAGQLFRSATKLLL